jgi:hypothetical protein
MRGKTRSLFRGIPAVIIMALILLGFAILFVLLLPLMLILTIHDGIHSAKFKKQYDVFLQQNDGAEFFCYTNRQNSEHFVQTHVLPSLDPTINVIHLVDRNPITHYEQAFISHMLLNIRQVGFPNIMKVSNNAVLDISLHNELYSTTNQNKDPDTFVECLRRNLDTLRASHASKGV